VHVTLWVLQGTLAAAFLMTGMMKAVLPKDRLKERMKWVEDFSQPQIRLVAVAELLGAFGVLVPPAVGILPIVSPVAAICLCVLMIGATWTHVRRREALAMIAPLMLLIVGVVVAAGRLTEWTIE